jgi:hypothetical protein
MEKHHAFKHSNIIQTSKFSPPDSLFHFLAAKLRPATPELQPKKIAWA